MVRAKAKVKAKVKSKAVSKPKPRRQQVPATVDENLPAYLQEDDVGAGNENVGVGDLQLPRLTILQKISDQVDPESDKYVEGAEPGMIFNTLTHELYESLIFCPAHFVKKFLVWKDERGGLLGIADTAEEAEGLRQDESDEIVFTPTHLVLVVGEDGEYNETTIPMAISKNKISKAFNSLVKLNRVDRFKRQYLLEIVRETNKRGEQYYNFQISNAPGDDRLPSEYVFDAAKSLYKAIQSGERKIADSSFIDPDDADLNAASNVDDEEEPF